MRIIEILEDAYSYNKTHEIYWKNMTPQEQAQWRSRAQQLLARARRIFQRLVSVMPAEERQAVAGVPIQVPDNGEMSWAAADYTTRTITMDVGCFWDLTDDCVAYVLGHEIGHFVYESKNRNYWKKKVAPAVNRQHEIDADTYGALLAFRLGYDARKAFDQFDREYRRAPFDPKYPSYPSVPQRQAAVNTAISNYKKAQQQPAEPAQQPAQQAPAQQPAEPPTSPGARQDLEHAMNGIQQMTAALTTDPQLAMTMFPGTTNGTALA